MQHSADKLSTSCSRTITLARSIFMEQQPPKEGTQSGPPPKLEKLGNVWQAFTQGEDATLSSGRTLHLSPELHEFVTQLMFNGVLNLHSLPEEILRDVCSRFSEGQK